jgi:ribosome recycling factor
MSKDAIFKKAHEKMESILSGVRKDFARIRTGKASIDLLDHCFVSAYGSEMPMNQVASLSVPEPRTIVISPWDKNTIPAIEKCILTSDLGLTPINDGKVVRINIPPLSEERRKELVKVAKNAAEEGRIHVRNVRRDANEHLKKLQKESELSEDELKRAETEVQKLTDEYVAKIDESLSHKEVETLEV